MEETFLFSGKKRKDKVTQAQQLRVELTSVKLKNKNNEHLNAEMYYQIIFK